VNRGFVTPRQPRGEEKEERLVKDRFRYRLWRLRTLRRNNQKGFTLIELLVVISILGILAAVVTMSMVGITTLAQQRAADAEKKTVQLALDTMANDQQVPTDALCATFTPFNAKKGSDGVMGTQDMANFPVSTSSAGLGNNPGGVAVALSPRYLRQASTYGIYTCDPGGVVSQHGWSPP
jgi:prepilin-type N-terminal cleavage/methylation domain-containing protein